MSRSPIPRTLAPAGGRGGYGNISRIETPTATTARRFTRRAPLVAVLAVLVALGPVACTGSPNASARALGNSLGGVSLGMTETQVLNARGTPDARGVTGGVGTPQWEYQEGLVVFLHLADPGAGALTVWRLLARPPFDGATVEGFKLGDSMDTFRQKYAAHAVTAPGPTQLLVRDRRGAVLSATFQSGGASEMTLQAP